MTISMHPSLRRSFRLEHIIPEAPGLTNWTGKLESHLLAVPGTAHEKGGQRRAML